MAKAPRSYGMDWIRIVATLAVVLFHVTMFLNPWDWHVKNNVTNSNVITGISLFLVQWIMPLFFVISGVSTFHALQSRSNGAFVKERALRLLPPLALAVVLLSPHQVYIERLTKGQFSGSFLEFLPHYLDGMYLFGGNFAWMGLHLWYVLVLFLFSLIALPLFRLAALRRMQDRLGDGAISAALLVVAPALAWVAEWLVPSRVAGAGGWGFLTYLVLFVAGYFLVAMPRGQGTVRKLGPVLVALAVISSVAFIWGTLGGWAWPDPVVGAVKALNSWYWVLALLYLGERYLNRSGPALQYWGDAVMPIYVLHQPIIVLLGFAIRDLAWHPVVKLLVLAPVVFGLIMALYQGVVRRFGPVRFIMGMK